MTIASEAAAQPPQPGRPLWQVALPFILAIELGGFLIGGLFGPQPGGWYFTLTKPSFNPPVWVFPVAWTLLYAMMATALAIVWRAPSSPARSRAIALFALQLALNYAWSGVFFGLQSLDGAVWAAAALLVAVSAATLAMARVSRVTLWLMGPYTAWTAFALVLSIAILRLNGG